MPTPPPTKERTQKIVDLYIKHQGHIRPWQEVAPLCGYLDGKSLKRLLEKWAPVYGLKVPPREYGAMTSAERAMALEKLPEPEIKMPELPSGDLPIHQIVEQLTHAAKQRIEAQDARRWVRVKVNSEGPFGIVWMGDPHVDDNGCAWPVLREHVSLIQKTPGLYCVGMGDYNNNWMGRLARLYAHQETSAATAWRLVEWLFREMGKKLILLIKGNHNLWTGAGDPLDFIKRPDTLSADWRVQLEFVADGADPIRAVAAHDFPGSSMWNPLHANQRQAVMGPQANIYVAGHRHTWGLAQHEDGEGRVYWLVRARGYKVIDGYAEQSGYAQQRYGHSVVSICNPWESEIKRVKCFSDVAEGAQYLTWLRKRWKACA